MALLSEKDRNNLIAEFEKLESPVRLIVFTQEFECQYCTQTREIAEELAELSEQISVEVYDFVVHKEIAEEYGIDKIPATIIMRGGDQPQDYGIRIYGIPAGYEFSSLVEDVMMVSRNDSGLSAETRAWISSLKTRLHLQVFVTPTCPHCPRAVNMAHQLAFESEFIQADMIEATEFPQLSVKYQVMGVPRTVINETEHLEGAAPEQMMLSKLKTIVG